MNSMILRTATRLLFPLLLIFSVFLFFRGHNEPGGGFIGGLVGAAAFVLFAIAFGTEVTRKLLRMDPRVMVGWGLFLALVSGIMSMIAGDAFFTGQWALPVVFGNELHVGTPLIFDIGVYLVVVGFTLAVIFALEEED
ncbi:multisubunit sodium/proton antiporter, MrpB subunit [Cyclonatronum proteinivorum]|uniref:Multisubunit sodium/proton antiporter, MrpB subunit n=1 Tax=Cyclonatronum proteinivorum TaxID=1457365 RepID=A0A345UHF1_9BACT|nr:Na+/H+ antiporter subunit B [Cyclonatronum proteinivorum]AXI99902.1 multisubunit sodium/proton antiporter, MrpB subunit [Cyclonatronum proteinivorum]